MVDILGMVFNRFASQLHVSRSTKLSYTESSTLVVGDEHINRSLLFLAAVTAASELGSKVMFFTQNKIQTLPFTLQGSNGLNLKPESLKKIRFVYPKTLEELLEDVASLHELVLQVAAVPSLVIVDGLDRYVCGPELQGKPQWDVQSAAAHVMALLHDTAAFLTQNLEARAETQAPCRVIVSVQPDGEGSGGGDVLAPDPFISVLERYLQVRCTSEKERGSEELNEWLLCLSGQALQIEWDVGKKEELKWRVILKPSGVLEFQPDSTAKQDTFQGQSTVEVKD